MKRIACLPVVLASMLAACTEMPAGPCSMGECGGGTGGGTGDAGPEPDAGPKTCDGPPGLYVDGSCTELAEGVRFFQPQHWLWTDAAGKQRYVYLPPATQIDTTDPDEWVFPVGTRLYKTFLVDGVKIETRVLEKTSDGVGLTYWTYMAYAWNEAQDAVTAVPSGVVDALGTGHDIPSQSDCLSCHAAAAVDMGLGFSAIQLNHDLVGLGLEDLRQEGRLTTDIDPLDAYAPGDATARAALGYLHANCGHCHGGVAPAGSGLKMRLLVGTANVESTDTYLTAVGVPSVWTEAGVTTRIVPGAPTESAVHARMTRRSFDQMPPLGTEVVDDDGADAVDAWIASLSGGS